MRDELERRASVRDELERRASVSNQRDEETKEMKKVRG